MSNEQNNQENEEIQMIVEEGNDNAEYLYPTKKVSTNSKSKVSTNSDEIRALSFISKVFYVLSILSVISMVIYFYISGKEFVEMGLFYQYYIIGFFLSSIFMSFCFGKLFEAINRIDINTKK
jgi:hypothetical protein